jgi:site-specific DNA-methyltransferase (adenine-specific)
MQPNTLYCGDNLQMLRDHFPDESVDLVYLDPPFNSDKDYNYIYRGLAGVDDTAQAQAFADTWSFADAATVFLEVTATGRPEAKLIDALHEAYGDAPMVAYLSVMALRVRELHRVLKPTGSLYLHCDPTAGHYLKLLLDCVFDESCFRNEIIWHYRKWSTGRYTFQRNHDTLFFYTKADRNNHTFNQMFMERAASTRKRFGAAKIVSARDAAGRRLPSAVEDAESEGVRQDDVWDIARVAPVKQLYPTQKPLALLERVISASSNVGDLVLDPFCGCATALVAAQTLGRQWCGIDITYLAVDVMRKRLSDSFPAVFPLPANVPVIGWPTDLAGARRLAADSPYDFQYWALHFIDANPPGGKKKKGADRGVDGEIWWRDGAAKLQHAVVSVKGGRSVTDTMLKDLITTVDAEKAAVGVFISLANPTAPMRSRAAQAGDYELAGTSAKYARIQMLTIAELLGGKRPDLPKSSRLDPHKAADAADEGSQVELDFNKP